LQQSFLEYVSVMLLIILFEILYFCFGLQQSIFKKSSSDGSYRVCLIMTPFCPSATNYIKKDQHLNSVDFKFYYLTQIQKSIPYNK
jgi:hypothetical protein